MQQSYARIMIAESRRSGAASIVADSFVPTKNELLDYVRLARSGNQFGSEYVVHGMSRLVFDKAAAYMIAWASHLPDHASFDDVFAGGMVGLQIAIDRFDESSGNAFTSYAVWYIRSEIQRVIYDLAGGGAIRAKAFVRGVAASDPMSGSTVRSLDEDVSGAVSTWGEQRSASNKSTRGDLTSDGADASTELLDTSLVCEILDMLAAIDPHMPQIARLLDTGFTEREIAREIGMPFTRVRELRQLAIEALV